MKSISNQKHGMQYQSRYAVLLALFFMDVFFYQAIADDQSVTLTPVFDYEIINTYPHDPRAFVQGLFYKDGFLYESTGQVGRSTIRKVALETGQIVQKKRFPGRVFGEGIVDWRGSLIGLTWHTERAYVWSLDDFELSKSWTYKGEGWGLTRNSQHLIMSNGTNTLQFLDPEDFSIAKTLDVKVDDRPLPNLNELEWINGEIWANIWQTNFIARINPGTGQVSSWIDLSGLLEKAPTVNPYADVLNGIAVAPDGRIFVTGKLWPALFEIKLVPRS